MYTLVAMKNVPHAILMIGNAPFAPRGHASQLKARNDVGVKAIV